MRIVVMDKEMREPLTIVDIPAHLMRQVEDGMPCIVLPVPASFRAWVSGYDFVPNAPMTDELRRVVLRMEKIVKSKSYPERGCEILFWTATPDDEDLALLLRAAFLPGQVTELRRREMQQWFMGALGAPPPAR